MYVIVYAIYVNFFIFDKDDMKSSKLRSSKSILITTFTYYQKIKKEIVISDPRRSPNYVKSNGAQNSIQHTIPLTKKVTCEVGTCSCDRLPSPRDSDVSSKRCSAAPELEWEGIELVMEDGCEMLKLSKEQEV